MKTYLFIAIMFMAFSARGQSDHSMKINDYTLGEKEVVVFTFGMDQKIPVGKIDDAGNITMDWSTTDVSALKNTDLYLGKFSGAFDYYCDENVIEKGSEDGAKVAKAGNVYLWNGTRWEGALIPASSTELKDYVLDNSGKDAVTGSYVQWIFADNDAQYSATCKETKFFYGGTEVKATKKFNLDLKKGWNILLVQIEEVAPVKDAAATPVLTTISTIESYPDDMIWFLKKF